MKMNNKTTRAIRTTGAGLLTVVMGTALLLSGCAAGGTSSSISSTTTWPSATPPPTSQTNTYIGTQSPGLYTVTIDHTKNTFSYQDLSTSGAVVSGTFTTTANGYLVLSTGGYALEMLSRAVVLDPDPSSTVGVTYSSTLGNIVFAISAPACQSIPLRTPFVYVGTPDPYYDDQFGTGNDEYAVSDDEYAVSGEITASTSNTGQDWEFDGANFSPNLFTATCAASNAGPSVIQSAITVPDSVHANFAVGPTGFFVEDNYQSSGVAFIGAVEPQSPVDLTQLKGATFLGMNVEAGSGTASAPQYSAPELVSVSAAPDSSGVSIELNGGVFLSNDPTQSPDTSIAIDLGPQDPQNNGSFPQAVFMKNGFSFAASAIVSTAGGKYSIFVTQATSGLINGFVLFQH